MPGLIIPGPVIPEFINGPVTPEFNTPEFIGFKPSTVGLILFMFNPIILGFNPIIPGLKTGVRGGTNGLLYGIVPSGNGGPKAVPVKGANGRGAI